MNTLLIAGIDPGTTTGYALLDVDGHVVLLGSGRNLGREEVVSRLNAVGTPFVVGCDKCKTPGLVVDVAASFGARVVFPDEDLHVADKRVMTRDFSCGNDHEADALASALLAFHAEESRIHRVRQRLKAENKKELETRVLPLVLKYGFSITAAMAIITTPPTELVRPVVTAVTENHFVTEKSVVALYNELVRLRDANKFLRAEVDKQRTRASLAEQVSSSARERCSMLAEKKAGRLLLQREERIRLLEQVLRGSQVALQRERTRLDLLTSELASMGEVVAVRYLSDLCGKELVSASCVFVDTPYRWSARAVAELRETSCVVLIDGPSRAPRIDGLRFLNASSLRRLVVGKWVFFNKEELDVLLASPTALKKIVEEYRKDRV